MEHQSMAAGVAMVVGIAASESCGERHRGLIEPTRQQRQGIARGLGVAGLDPAVGHADGLSIGWLRRTATQLASR